MGRAARAWSDALASWAIPPEILAQAPEDPWSLPVAPFARAAEDAERSDTASREAARGALPEGGSVLDVGCGAGAAALAVAEHAGEIVGVDESAEMLERFGSIAAERGLAVRTILGRWPDVAPSVGTADVVLCHHVLYNVAAIEPFVRALNDHAECRVVVEITSQHPRAWMNPFWTMFWGIERPMRPTADDAVAVLHEMGVVPEVARWEMPGHATHPDELVPMMRRYLCLPVGREPEVAAALGQLPRPSAREIVTLWWDVG